MQRPTFEEIQAENDKEWDLIGPPAPLQMPKMTPPKDRAAVREMLDQHLAHEIAFRTKAWGRKR